MSTRNVGVIGVGQMGRGMARRLDAAGRLGAVWDCSASGIAAAQLSDEVAVLRPDALAARCDLVLFVVPGSAEIEVASRATTACWWHRGPA